MDHINNNSWQSIIMSHLHHAHSSTDESTSNSPRMSQSAGSQSQSQSQSASGGPLESIPEYESESEQESDHEHDQHDQPDHLDLAQAVESTGLGGGSLVNTPTTSALSSASSSAGTGTGTPNPPRSRLRSIDVPAISLPSSADVLTSLPDPRPLHVAAMRSSPGTQAHDLLATMESVLDPGTPRNVFNDLLRADRASIPDSLWVPKIALMFADAPWLVEAFLMVVGWIGPDPLMMSHVAPASPPMSFGSVQQSAVPVFHARMPSPNFHAGLMGTGNPLGRSVSPPGTAKGWFIDHPPSPMHAVSHPTASAAQQEGQQLQQQTPPMFQVSPAAAGCDDGFANFQIPTILHSPVASPRESPSQSPNLSANTPSPVGLGLDVSGGEIDPDSVPLAPSLLQVKPVGEGNIHRPRSPLAQSWTEAEAETGDITDVDQPRGPHETLGGLPQVHQVGGPTSIPSSSSTTTQQAGDDDNQDDDPLSWVDETSSSGSAFQPGTTVSAPADPASTILTPSKLIETYTQLDKSRAHLPHLPHLPPCGKLPSGNPAVLPLPQRMQQHQHQQMYHAHHPAAAHHAHHSHAAHAHALGHGHGHRDHHGGFLHPSIAFGIHHGARHASGHPAAPHAHAHPHAGQETSPRAFHGPPDHVQMPGPHSEDPRSSPHLAEKDEEGDKEGAGEEHHQEHEHIRAARDRGHDSYALQKALSERRLGMDI